ncbi:MAG: hypothetical protein ABWJ42_01850 [Sulfolobales archaeon]
MSIGEISHNIIAVLELAVSSEEYLSLLYTRLRFLTRDSELRILFEYLAQISHVHRDIIKDILDLSVQKLDIPAEKIGDIMSLMISGFRDVRELYNKALETYEIKDIIRIVEELESSVRNMLTAYSMLKEYQIKDEKIRYLIELLERDSERNVEILRNISRYLNSRV